MLRISWTTQNITADDGGGTELTSSTVEHTLEFDAVTSETHEATSVVTEHATEGGLTLSDHKRADPRRVVIDAVVTNTPTGEPPASGYGETDPVTAAVEKADSGVSVVRFSGPFDRRTDVFDTLERLLREPTLVTVSTSVTTYEQMTVVNVSAPREGSDGSSIKFKVELVEVRIANTSLVDSPRPREPRGGVDESNGNNEAESLNQSTLSTITESVRDFYNEVFD